jgi:hypothetical protein
MLLGQAQQATSDQRTENSQSGSWAGPTTAGGVCGCSLPTEQVGVKQPPIQGTTS